MNNSTCTVDANSFLEGGGKRQGRGEGKVVSSIDLASKNCRYYFFLFSLKNPGTLKDNIPF